MIKVCYDKDYQNISIKGHAGHDLYGKDIVCASVSSIIITSVNLALMYDEKLDFTEDEGCVLINNINVSNDILKNIFINMINMLCSLEEQYPNNIKIKKGE